MGGDGTGAMALGIGLFMVALPPGGFLLFLLAVRAAAHWRGVASGKAWRLGLAAGIVGLILGTLALLANFHPDTWRPRPEIRLVLPPGSDPTWVVLLESPARGRTLEWKGVEMPFGGIRTTIAVPHGGIVRVRSLDRIDTNANVVWPDGRRPVGAAAGPAPPGLGATSYVAWTLRGTDSADQGLPFGDSEQRERFMQQERIR